MSMEFGPNSLATISSSLRRSLCARMSSGNRSDPAAAVELAMKSRRFMEISLVDSFRFQVVAPAARGGDVLLSRDRVSLADEPLHPFPVLQLQRADAERRRNLGDEGAE